MSNLTEQFKVLNSNLGLTAKNYLKLKSENDRLEEKYKELKQNWGKESQEVLDNIENELSLAKKQDEDSAFLEFEINCLEEDINGLDKEDNELRIQIQVLKEKLKSLESTLNDEEQYNARVEARNKQLEDTLNNLGHKDELERLKREMIRQLDKFGDNWNKEFNESLTQMLKTLRDKYQVGVQSSADSQSVKSTVNVSFVFSFLNKYKINNINLFQITLKFEKISQDLIVKKNQKDEELRVLNEKLRQLKESKDKLHQETAAIQTELKTYEALLNG